MAAQGCGFLPEVKFEECGNLDYDEETGEYTDQLSGNPIPDVRRLISLRCGNQTLCYDVYSLVKYLATLERNWIFGDYQGMLLNRDPNTRWEYTNEQLEAIRQKAIEQAPTTLYLGYNVNLEPGEENAYSGSYDLLTIMDTYDKVLESIDLARRGADFPEDSLFLIQTIAQYNDPDIEGWLYKDGIYRGDNPRWFNVNMEPVEGPQD